MDGCQGTLLEQEQSQSESMLNDHTVVLNGDEQAVIAKQESMLQRKREELDALQNDLQTMENRRHQLMQQHDQQTERENELKRQEEQFEKQIYSVRNTMQELLQKRNNAMALLDEKRREISTISSIPEGADRYRDYSPELLKRKLDEANKKLLKFDKVNRKALDQYKLFDDKRNDFDRRHQELVNGMESIHGLIRVSFSLWNRF